MIEGRPANQSANSISSRCLSAGIVLRQIRGQLAEHEFLEEIDGSSRADSNERVFDYQVGLVVLGWVLERRDGSRGEASENTGVVRLPVAVVALADHGVGHRVEGPLPLGAGAFVKVTRILLEQ